MSGFPSFLRLNDISLSGWTTSCSAHTWVASTCWLLWAALPWTWGHKYPEALFSRCISESGVAGLYGSSASSAHRLQFLYPSLTLVIFCFLIVTVLMGMRCFSLWSWFAFLRLLVMLSFHILFGHLCMIFEEMSVQMSQMCHHHTLPCTVHTGTNAIRILESHAGKLSTSPISLTLKVGSTKYETS